MRSVVAKRLRREAENRTIGKSSRRLVQHHKTGVVLNDPKSTRAVYRALKKEYGRG